MYVSAGGGPWFGRSSFLFAELWSLLAGPSSILAGLGMVPVRLGSD